MTLEIKFEPKEKNTIDPQIMRIVAGCLQVLNQEGLELTEHTIYTENGGYVREVQGQDERIHGFIHKV